MQAKQTRYRHFRSSVGTLLNENYGAITNKKRPPVILSTAPASPNVPLSPKTPEIFAAKRSRPGLVAYGTTTVSGVSDRQSPQTCAGHDELDGTHCDSEDNRASLTPTSSGTPADSQTRKYDRPCSQTTSFSRSTQGPASRYAQINGSNKSSRPQMNSSVACRTSTYTPKSERSLPLSSTRVHTPVGIPEDEINLEVPRYYDAYKHMFDLTSKHGSSRLDDVIVEQDSKNLDAIPDRSDITWPRIIRKNQEENVLKRCSTSRSSRVSSARSHVFSNDIFTPSPRPTGLSASMSPAGFIRSKSATSSASSRRVSMGSRSSCGQQNNGAKTSRSSAGYDDTVSRLLLEVKMQQPGEWYTGHTPTHTPTPDSSLPYYQSRSWLKHYSPTKIRHFFHAAGGSLFSGSIS